MFGQFGNRLLCVFASLNARPDCAAAAPLTLTSPLHTTRAVDRIRNSSLQNQAKDSTCSPEAPPSVPFARFLPFVRSTDFGPLWTWRPSPKTVRISPSLELPTDLYSTDPPDSSKPGPYWRQVTSLAPLPPQGFHSKLKPRE